MSPLNLTVFARLQRHYGIILPDEKWGEVIAAFVRTAEDMPWDADNLKSFCRSHLSPQKTPSIWRHVDAFPLTGSGKIQKFKIREKYLSGDYE